jgi:hypothetical protein
MIDVPPGPAIVMGHDHAVELIGIEGGYGVDDLSCLNLEGCHVHRPLIRVLKEIFQYVVTVRQIVLKEVGNREEAYTDE